MSSPEQLQTNSERGVESKEAAAEQLEKLRSNPESAVEISPRDAEKRAENARFEALETAISIESGSKEKMKGNESSAPKRRGPISKKQKEASFKRQMKEVQTQLSPTSRLFSKVIHNKAIEKTSELVGATVARPNAILAGAVSAFILTLGIYLLAKNLGYVLSGFETIGTFILGWIIGILYDYFRVLITGKP